MTFWKEGRGKTEEAARFAAQQQVDREYEWAVEQGHDVRAWERVEEYHDVVYLDGGKVEHVVSIQTRV